MSKDLVSGLSVVIPTYSGALWIEQALSSLASQTLSPSLFEIVVVANGPDDGTVDIVREFDRTHPQLNIRLLRLPAPSVARAINFGMAAARREFVTIVDDDDRVSNEYLEVLLAHSATHTVAHCHLADVVDPHEPPSYDNYITRALSGAAGRQVHPDEVQGALSFNVAKTVSTVLARSVKVREDLRAAPDAVFWNELVNTFRLTITVVERNSHAVYYRQVREGSHSRPSEQSWQFGVQARLDAIAALQPIATDPSQYLHSVSSSAARSQARAIAEYLKSRPGEHARLIQEVSVRGIDPQIWPALNENRARVLVAAYAFAPFSDTSALVAARRLRARGDIVDVIAHDMSNIRHEDASGTAIVAPYVARTAVVNRKAAFANWKNIARYCVTGLKAAEEWTEDQPAYEAIYSRAMWPGSHVLAALYTTRHPGIRWDAEFSDPLSRDIHNKIRAGDRDDDELTQELEHALVSAGYPSLPDMSLFEWVEHITYVLADQFIFTNEHQLAYMLEHIASESLRARVAERSVISAHPTLPTEFYDMSTVDYPLDADRVHIAYFGAFYATRGLTEVVEAVKQLTPEQRQRLSIHIFTSDPQSLTDELRGDSRLEPVFIANPYVPYLDFLHLTTLFDCLLVNDVHTAGTHDLNPYLPSKLSDYRGSGSDIWALAEPGSILSREVAEFKSELGNPEAAARVISDVIAKRFP